MGVHDEDGIDTNVLLESSQTGSKSGGRPRSGQESVGDDMLRYIKEQLQPSTTSEDIK